MNMNFWKSVTYRYRIGIVTKNYYLSMISPRLRFMVTGLDRDCVFSKFVICNVALIDVIELSTILVASCTGCDEL